MLRETRNRKHPKRRKKARKADRKIKTIARRLVRKLERRLPEQTLEQYREELDLFQKILSQKRTGKDKIYNLSSINNISFFCNETDREYKDQDLRLQTFKEGHRLAEKSKGQEIKR